MTREVPAVFSWTAMRRITLTVTIEEIDENGQATLDRQMIETAKHDKDWMHDGELAGPLLATVPGWLSTGEADPEACVMEMLYHLNPGDSETLKKLEHLGERFSMFRHSPEYTIWDFGGLFDIKLKPLDTD